MAMFDVVLRHDIMDPNTRDSMLKQFLLMVGGDRSLNFLKWYECGFVVDVALNFSDAMEKVSKSGILDLVVVDLTWNRTGAAHFCSEVRRLCPGTKVVALVAGAPGLEVGLIDLALDYRTDEEELINQISNLSFEC